jgi:hypothetical protein
LLAVVCDAHFFINGFPLYFKHLHEYDDSMTRPWASAASTAAPVDVPARMDAGSANE